MTPNLPAWLDLYVPAHGFTPERGQAHAVVHIVHGMSEHVGRYQVFAERLSRAGYAVAARNVRGHGPTPKWRGHYADQAGWSCVLDDVQAVHDGLTVLLPGVPQVLFGHSMGSFIARSFFLREGERLAGLMLSSPGFQQATLARVLQRVAQWLGRRDMRMPNRALSRLVFGSFALGFPPWRTRFDWLSRDVHAVDAYRADPLCGADCSAQLWSDLFAAIIAMEAQEAQGYSLNRTCAVFLLAGSRDPVSMHGRALRQLAARYQAAGLTDVHTQCYPGGRHEMLHEMNRVQVMDDCIAWLDARFGAHAS